MEFKVNPNHIQIQHKHQCPEARLNSHHIPPLHVITKPSFPKLAVHQSADLASRAVTQSQSSPSSSSSICYLSKREDVPLCATLVLR